MIDASADASPAGLAAGMSLGALSLPGGMLTAPLGAVPPGMTLLEALQTRGAQDALSALEAARAPSRHPLDISSQVQLRAHPDVLSALAAQRFPSCSLADLNRARQFLRTESFLSNKRVYSHRKGLGRAQSQPLAPAFDQSLSSESARPRERRRKEYCMQV